MTVFGEKDCEYLNDGKGAGILKCPSFGEGRYASCKGDLEKDKVTGKKDCLVSLTLNRYYHRVAVCEF